MRCLLDAPSFGSLPCSSLCRLQTVPQVGRTELCSHHLPSGRVVMWLFAGLNMDCLPSFRLPPSLSPSPRGPAVAVPLEFRLELSLLSLEREGGGTALACDLGSTAD